MQTQQHLSQLQRQNALLKILVLLLGLIATGVIAMGAASFNQDRGELLGITKIQLVDDHGTQVALIDAKGITYSAADSQLVAAAIIGRRRVEANATPGADQRYVELGVTSDNKCYMELSNKGATYHDILSATGTLETNF